MDIYRKSPGFQKGSGNSSSNSSEHVEKSTACSLVDKTKIVDLLIRRDKQFVEVWKAESVINRLTDNNGYFPPVCELASTRKKKKKAPAKTKKTSFSYQTGHFQYFF